MPGKVGQGFAANITSELLEALKIVLPTILVY